MAAIRPPLRSLQPQAQAAPLSLIPSPPPLVLDLDLAAAITARFTRLRDDVITRMKALDVATVDFQAFYNTSVDWVIDWEVARTLSSHPSPSGSFDYLAVKGAMYSGLIGEYSEIEESVRTFRHMGVRDPERRTLKFYGDVFASKYQGLNMQPALDRMNAVFEAEAFGRLDVAAPNAEPGAGQAGASVVGGADEFNAGNMHSGQHQFDAGPQGGFRDQWLIGPIPPTANGEAVWPYNTATTVPAYNLEVVDNGQAQQIPAYQHQDPIAGQSAYFPNIALGEPFESHVAMPNISGYGLGMAQNRPVRHFPRPTTQDPGCDQTARSPDAAASTNIALESMIRRIDSGNVDNDLVPQVPVPPSGMSGFGQNSGILAPLFGASLPAASIHGNGFGTMESGRTDRVAPRSRAVPIPRLNRHSLPVEDLQAGTKRKGHSDTLDGMAIMSRKKRGKQRQTQEPATETTQPWATPFPRELEANTPSKTLFTSRQKSIGQSRAAGLQESLETFPASQL